MIRAQKRALAKSMDKPEDHYSYQFKALELNESILRGPVSFSSLTSTNLSPAKRSSHFTNYKANTAKFTHVKN